MIWLVLDETNYPINAFKSIEAAEAYVASHPSRGRLRIVKLMVLG